MTTRQTATNEHIIHEDTKELGNASRVQYTSNSLNSGVWRARDEQFESRSVVFSFLCFFWRSTSRQLFTLLTANKHIRYTLKVSRHNYKTRLCNFTASIKGIIMYCWNHVQTFIYPDISQNQARTVLQQQNIKHISYPRTSSLTTFLQSIEVSIPVSERWHWHCTISELHELHVHVTQELRLAKRGDWIDSGFCVEHGNFQRPAMIN